MAFASVALFQELSQLQDEALDAFTGYLYGQVRPAARLSAAFCAEIRPRACLSGSNGLHVKFRGAVVLM